MPGVRAVRPKTPRYNVLRQAFCRPPARLRDRRPDGPVSGVLRGPLQQQLPEPPFLPPLSSPLVLAFGQLICQQLSFPPSLEQPWLLFIQAFEESFFLLSFQVYFQPWLPQ